MSEAKYIFFSERPGSLALYFQANEDGTVTVFFGQNRVVTFRKEDVKALGKFCASVTV